jgi:predicted transglutaminase-like cysteine proteinase
MFSEMDWPPAIVQGRHRSLRGTIRGRVIAMRRFSGFIAAGTMVVMGLASAGPAQAFGLGSVSRPLDKAVESLYVPSRARVAAPFAHVVFCTRNPSECAVSGQGDIVALSPDRKRQMVDVNRSVNRRIIGRNDSPGEFGGDVWTVAARSGDCEDYAITKRHELIRLGWPSAALRLAVARTAWGEGHMVLVVRTDRGDLVLDNLTGSIRNWKKTGLRWEMIQASENPRMWKKI